MPRRLDDRAIHRAQLGRHGPNRCISEFPRALRPRALRGEPIGMIETELLVVGAGPAGLAAATEAARRGIETVLIDEHRGTGGMLNVLGQVVVAGDRGARTASEIRRAMHTDAERAGVTVIDQSLVWGIFEDLLAGVLTPAENLEIRPQTMIVAAGTADRPMPFSGWTLPY